FRTMPFTALCGIIGALAISGFPLTSGFTTKTMISQAAASEGLMVVYLGLAAASAGVFLHAGIKFPWFVFFQKDSGLRPKDAPWNMGIAMGFFAALCLLLGIAPGLLYEYLPYPVDYVPYSASKVLFYLQLLLFSGLAFFLLLPLMQRTLTISLDFDWFWRVVLYRAGSAVLNGIEWLQSTFGERLAQGLEKGRRFANRHMGRPDPEERAGVLSRTWPIGVTALWIAILLSAYIGTYYL
ncbi:MAG: Na+/H+ antiporter subunit D, partial [Pseudomonadota bacterium]